jgi:hypothetical protein
MFAPATFESFEKELNRLVESFGKRLAELKKPGYAEAQLRDDFLNPFFRALGWDMENRAGLIQQEREVEIESATQIGGGRKRADYLFRTDKRERFVCEAKKPAEELNAKYAFQTKRYAWNKNVWLGILTDFEEMKVYVVGGKPHLDEPLVGLWQSWHFRQYPLIARELWDLLAHEKVAAGSVEQLIDSLPKKPTGKGKLRQQWLIKPDRTRTLDVAFLEFLDETRRDLASDIYKNNDHDLLDGNRLTEACQRIIDRILFLRICEDRDIDTGTTLQSIVETWRKNTGDDDTGRRAYQQPFEKIAEFPPAAGYGSGGIRAPKSSLWRRVIEHFRALDRRPPSHVPFFNGNLFKPHDSEKLILSDEWLAGFIGELSDDATPYLFSEIPVEILGSVYERFLGKVVVLRGRGIAIDEKPEVRKAGGVYYTPRYIVDYIVEQTAGKLLDEIAAGAPISGSARTDASPNSPNQSSALRDFEKKTAALRFLDPACGSGSFLICAFERVCKHWLQRLTDALPPREQKAERAAWEKKHRPLCWVDPATNDVHLTVALKRQILTQNIYGVDLDAAAVEVTQLSLYLKMLENENRTTLQRQRELLADETEIALLPPLQDNIKCGNSLIASDFLDGELLTDELVKKLSEVKAFDWSVQFTSIIKAGGFDAVIGNPPYGMVTDEETKPYFERIYVSAEGRFDLFELFLERAVKLAKANGGKAMFIIPSPFLTNVYSRKLRQFLIKETSISEITNFGMDVFADPTVHTCIVGSTRPNGANNFVCIRQQVRKPEELSLGFNYTVEQHKLAQGENSTFDIFLTPSIRGLVEKLELHSSALSDVCHIRQCIKTGDDDKYVSSSVKRPSSDWKPSLRGRGIERYGVHEKDLWLKYGDWLARNWQNKSFYEVQKIAVRETGARIIAALDDENRYFLSSLYSVYPIQQDEPHSLKYLLGIINSNLATWFIRLIAFELTEGAFTKIRTNQFGRLPIRKIDFKKAADKSRHDKLVVLVDKLLGLMPKLRAATLDAEKAVLQNAVTATDQQIDALVYDLYGLTAAEIKLVEGNA